MDFFALYNGRYRPRKWAHCRRRRSSGMFPIVTMVMESFLDEFIYVLDF